MRLIILIFWGGISISPSLFAQSGPPITVSVLNHSWAFPLSKVIRTNGPVYPGVSVGTEHSWRKKNRNQWVQSAELGGYLNRSMGSALYASSEFRYRRHVQNGLRPETGIGLGYFHAFSPTPLLQQQADGHFAEIKDKGKGGSLVSISMGMGYAIPRPEQKPLAIFIKYQWMAATPFTDIIPIRPTGLLHLGIRASL